MKLLALRGSVPKDRSPKEIMYDGLTNNDDMWEHLFCALGDERCEILYWGGNRIRRYTDKDTVVWVRDLKHYSPDFKPDVVFERGGFDEGRRFSKQYPDAYRIYYGAGKRCLPRNTNLKYDLVLVDSERQLRKARKHGWNAQLWFKPASPQFRYMPEVAKYFDVCYVADGRFPFRAKIKNVDWVYETIPKDLKLLHLGWAGDRFLPKNITVMRVQRAEMPLYYNKCRVGVIPYTGYDSAPRVIPEMIACGLPVLVSDEVNTNQGQRIPKENLWDNIKSILKNYIPVCGSSTTIQSAAEQIRGYINAEKRKDGDCGN